MFCHVKTWSRSGSNASMVYKPNLQTFTVLLLSTILSHMTCDKLSDDPWLKRICVYCPVRSKFRPIVCVLNFRLGNEWLNDTILPTKINILLSYKLYVTLVALVFKQNYVLLRTIWCNKKKYWLTLSLSWTPSSWTRLFIFSIFIR